MTGALRRQAARAAKHGTVVLLAGVLVAGCQFDGVGSLPLPLREGVGDGSTTVTVEMEQIANLVPNAEVKVDDVTVGVVRAADVQNWHAILTVGLNPGVVLPANAEARVGQKSLLGAEYLELARPTNGPAVGTLRDGDTIPLARTGRYPETEEVLAALSVVLNGGGLQQVRTITTELNAALGGHEQDIQRLIGNLNTLVGTLDRQSADIVRAIEGLNRFSGTLARDNQVLADGLEAIPPALRALNEDREALLAMLRRVGVFGDVAVRVLNASRDDLLANLRQLRPAVQRLADSGSDLTQSLSGILTFPFPARTSFPTLLRGDYGNLYAEFDLSPEILVKNFLGGFDIDGLGLLNAPPLGAGQQTQPPFAPFLAPGGPPAGAPPGGGAAPEPEPGDSSGGDTSRGGPLGGLLGGNG
jgi:phospholipid/cholesterol/gamma-HCH transport system substrate-binding protein